MCHLAQSCPPDDEFPGQLTIPQPLAASLAALARPDLIARSNDGQCDTCKEIVTEAARMLANPVSCLGFVCLDTWSALKAPFQKVSRATCLPDLKDISKCPAAILWGCSCAASSSRHHLMSGTCHCTMRFGSTTRVLAKCMLKYYRISGCGPLVPVGLEPCDLPPGSRCLSLIQDLTAPASPRGAHALFLRSGKPSRGPLGILKSAVVLCITSTLLSWGAIQHALALDLGSPAIFQGPVAPCWHCPHCHLP